MSAGDQANAREYVAKMRERGRTDEEIRRRMLQHGWSEQQLAGLFGATAATPRPRPARAAHPQDIGGGLKVGIILTAVLVPLAGFIWGLVYLVSSHAARKRWGAWALGISLLVGVGDLLLIGCALSHGGIPRIGAGREAAKTECQQNLKNLAVAVVMFSVDHGDRLPDAARWQEQVRPYFNSEALCRCPSGGTYAMNPQLSRRSMPEIYRMGNPAQIVLFYEVDDRGNPLRDVHDGGANYAYVAGNVSWRKASR